MLGFDNSFDISQFVIGHLLYYVKFFYNFQLEFLQTWKDCEVIRLKLNKDFMSDLILRRRNLRCLPDFSEDAHDVYTPDLPDVFF